MRKEFETMGMIAIVEIIDKGVSDEPFEKVFNYFDYIDHKFSPYREESEVTMINKGLVRKGEESEEMKEVMKLADETKREADGYFDVIDKDGKFNPSGIVKGWAIWNAAKILSEAGYQNFFVEIAGDVEVHGVSGEGTPWKVGIRNPFKPNEIVKVVSLSGCGIATSGTYARGEHIYNPHKSSDTLEEVASLSVIGPSVYEADRFATACFAMGKEGINFIEKLEGFEGYMIDKDGIATFTSNFEKYINKDD